MKWIKGKYPHTAVGVKAIYNVYANGNVEIYWHDGKPPMPGKKPSRKFLQKACLMSYKKAINVCEKVDAL